MFDDIDRKLQFIKKQQNKKTRKTRPRKSTNIIILPPDSGKAMLGAQAEREHKWVVRKQQILDDIKPQIIDALYDLLEKDGIEAEIFAMRYVNAYLPKYRTNRNCIVIKARQIYVPGRNQDPGDVLQVLFSLTEVLDEVNAVDPNWEHMPGGIMYGEE